MSSSSVGLILPCLPSRSSVLAGGLNTYSRALAAHLVPLEGEPLVSVSTVPRSSSPVSYPIPTARAYHRQVFCRTTYYVSFLATIVDAYIRLIALPSRYLGAEFTKILEKPVVDYKQANLTVPCASKHKLILSRPPHAPCSHYSVTV